MKETLLSYVDRIDTMSTREKLLLTIILLVVLFVTWQLFFDEPLKQKAELTHNKLQLTEDQLKTLTAQIVALKNKPANLPSLATAQQHASMQREVSHLNEHFSVFVNQLVSPQAMVNVIQRLLTAHPGVKLVSLKDDGTALIELAKKAHTGSGLSQLYAHKLTLQLEGSFFDVLSYLEQLETLDWLLFWDGMTYKVTEYPKARIDIQLHTLSKEPGLIGV